MSFGFRKLGVVPEPEAPMPGALGGPGTLGMAIMEYGADVVSAENASRYVTELGDLTPECVRKAWNGEGWGGRHGGLRATLLERGALLRDLVNATAAADIREDAIALLNLIDARASTLPVAPDRSSAVLGYPAGWTDPESYPVESSPRPPMGSIEDTLRDWVDRGYSVYPEFVGYILLAPRLVGTLPNLLYWVGAWSGKAVASGLVDVLRRAVTAEQASFVRGATDAHWKWQSDLRGIYKQLWTTHVIAQVATSRDSQIGGMMAADPRIAPTPPVLWNGVLPDSASSSSGKPPSVWWLVGALAATVGVLWVASD